MLPKSPTTSCNNGTLTSQPDSIKVAFNRHTRGLQLARLEATNTIGDEIITYYIPKR